MVKLKKVGKIIGVLAGLLIALFLTLFTWVDRRPYTETSYYRNTMERLEQLKANTEISRADTMRVGWARVNITPTNSLPMAGYGKRRGAKFSSVHDSIWARAFVFDDGRKKSTLVTVDLLIMPPEVSLRLQKRLGEMGFADSFFTASHSHSSIGSWATGVTGRLFAGKYDPATVDTLVNRIIKAVQLADNRKAQATIGYGAFKTEGLVYNRAVRERGSIDPWLRVFRIQKIDSSTAIFASFSAHATCLSSKTLSLSGDYPGFLVQALESLPELDFAAFGAGAMASQGPILFGGDEYSRATEIAQDLTNQIRLGLNFMPSSFTNELSAAKLAIDLREPHFRISTNIRMRPWLFSLLVGHYPIDIKVLRIGDILLVGTPCDFSGELVEALEQKARAKGLNLIITSFNGGYMGYVTKDEWYDEDLYETRTMNWYGPYNGAYFVELIEGIIEIF